MPSVSNFLLERMENAGIKHVFGVPGDYVLNFYKKLSDNKNIEVVNTTDESHAGFAADAYARINGIGCVCVTYNVGALKLANAIACAYAERSPVVMISGSPGIKERAEGMLLHHMVRSFECQKQIFENITCASAVLTDPTKAGYEIDRAFEALKYHKQPIYIELPRDIADKTISYDVYRQGTPQSPIGNEEDLNDALEDTLEWLNNSKNPVILAGVQVARYGLGKDLLKFAEKSNIPIATTLLSKSVIDETHPLNLGVYAGETSQTGVQAAVENSDCLLMFGVLLTDMTLNFMPSRFNKRQIVSSSVEGMKIKNKTYGEVNFESFLRKLFKTEVNKKDARIESLICKERNEFVPQENAVISASRFFDKINSIIDENHIIVADVGDSLFGSMDLIVRDSNNFLSPAYYTSMGFAIPGTLGALCASDSDKAIVIVGDGAFQMSCTELSTILDKNLNAIVFVLNNRGYTTERFLLDGPFNNIRNWKYENIVNLIDGGTASTVSTEEELEKTINLVLQEKGLHVINVNIDQFDVSPALKRMTEGLSKRVVS